MFEDKPIDQAAHDETLRIYSDKTHPHYEGWKRGDKAAVAYRDSLLVKAWGSGGMDSGDLGPNAERILAESMGMKVPGASQEQPQQPSSPVETPTPAEPAKEWTQPDAETYLRMQFTQEGRDYDQVINEVGQGVAAFFEGEDGDLVTRFLGRVGNDPEFVLLARRVVNRLRAKGAI